MDTIFAPATARGKAGVAIVRVSGAKALVSVEVLAQKPVEFGKASLRVLRNSSGEMLDEALVLTFAEGSSYTGEDTVELHLHGSPAVVAAVLKVLGEIPGYRAAEAGEFTRRALLNGQLDLAQVEGLADLLEAETEAQRIQAIRVFDGRLGELTEGWRSKLIRAAALLEATIDFADEEVPVDVSPEVSVLLDTVYSELSEEMEGSAAAQGIRNGFEVAIIGSPNAGKSTLLNRLAGREAALTSTIAGTTRDVIEVRMDLGGLPVTILDTAGIRETNDEIEALGVNLATSRAENADLRIFLCDTSDDPWPVSKKPGDIRVLGKADQRGETGFGVSGLTGLGVAALIQRLTQELEQRAAGGSSIIRERHKAAIGNALEALNYAKKRLDDSESDPEIVAEEIRATVRSLDSLIGNVGVEDLLGEVFSSFCIGK